MVRRGGYRTSAQKHGGGKTRRQQLREKLQRHRRRLRENGLVELVFSSKPATLARQADNGYAVFGVHRDGSEWVLTGLAVSDEYEKMNPGRAGGYSKIEVRSRYIMPGGNDGIQPEQGIEIKRFDTKAEALSYVSADGSERVEPGRYLIRPEHNPRHRSEEVDKDDYQGFFEKAVRVRE